MECSALNEIFIPHQLLASLRDCWRRGDRKIISARDRDRQQGNSVVWTHQNNCMYELGCSYSVQAQAEKHDHGIERGGGHEVPCLAEGATDN